jgi:hypothetical protein
MEHVGAKLLTYGTLKPSIKIACKYTIVKVHFHTRTGGPTVPVARAAARACRPDVGLSHVIR